MRACLTLLFLAVAAPAWAQVACTARDALLAQLASRYQEHVVATGTMQGSLMEFAAAKSGTWTMILSNPETGMACIVAAGEGFDTARPKPAGQES